MNLVSFLISSGISLLSTPFPETVRGENGITRSDRNNDAGFSIFPFNVLRNTPACSTINFMLGK